MEEVRLLLLFLFLQICSRVGATEYPRLTFAAIGDFGGIPLPPYSTYMQKKIAKVMGKVRVYKESLFDFTTLLLLVLWSLISLLLVACIHLFKFNGWPLLELAKGTELLALYVLMCIIRLTYQLVSVVIKLKNNSELKAPRGMIFI